MLAQLPAAAQKGIDLAFAIEKQIRARAGFEDFDFAQVFWRTVYGIGIFYLVSYLWRLKKHWEWIIDPVTGVFAFTKPFTALDCKGKIKRLELYFLRLYRYQPTPEELAEFIRDHDPDTYEACYGEEEEPPEEEAKHPLDLILVDYRNEVMMCIPLLFLFLEYRAYQRRKAYKVL